MFFFANHCLPVLHMHFSLSSGTDKVGIYEAMAARDSVLADSQQIGNNSMVHHGDNCLASK
jgi:hypothetical protein